MPARACTWIGASPAATAKPPARPVVRYSQLLDVGRLTLEDWAGPRPVMQRLQRWALRATLPNAPLVNALVATGAAVRFLLPKPLAGKLPRAKASPPSWPSGRHTRTVLMLEGCVQPALSPNTNAAAARILDRLQRSTNQGNNWSGIQPPNSSSAGFYAPFVVCRSNPTVLYAGSNYVHKSTNQGSSWTLMNGGQVLDGNPLLAMTVSNYSTDTIYATTSPVSSRGRVFVSTNGGTSWTNITGTLPDSYLTDIAIVKNNASIVYVTVAGYGTSHLFKSTNGGQNWIDIGATLPDAPGFCVIVDPLNQNNVFFGNDITVYASTDAGSSWFEYSNGLPDAVYVYDINIVATNHRIRVATHGNGVYEADIDLVIPVELISFAGRSENNNIVLNWSTATELNNKGFEIERSVDNKDFITRGFGEGSGTTTEKHEYSFTERALNGKVFYRLKQIDFDGNYSYSKSVEINSFYVGNFELYQNYPNPFNPSTKIKFTIQNVIANEVKQSQHVALKIYDALANEIATLVNEEKQPGTYEVDFNGLGLPSGTYFYKLKAGNFETTKKMVLIK